ncbi:MAG: hypothetical protein IJG24_03055, partial [Selenomonadaceae bacterium]|nr:hypothetical protein [Selenomonadaceae bacterium]
AHYSKLERIDKECKILGNSEQTNGSIYREVAFYNADHAHSWAVKTADGKIIISGKGKPDFDKIVAAANNAELQFDLNRFDEPVNNGDTPSPENKEDTSMTNTKPTATTDEIREACMEAQTQLETKIAAGAPESEVKAVVDKDGNEIKPTTPLTTAEMNAAIDRLVAEFDREQAEAQKPLSLADLKAKYDASEDEAERVAIAINAYRKFLEPEKIKQERQIAEQVCASLTADAPQGWAVTFTDKGNYEVTAHGLSAATIDTITAGDFINPKAFFAKFNRTQADIDNERETAIAELKNQREQLLNMRAELVADFPDEKERLKILDEMIVETDQDIAVFENLTWKPGMFDDKHFNEDNLPF